MGYRLPVDLADNAGGAELHRLFGVLENLDLHPARIRQPALPGVVDTELLWRDRHAMSRGIGHEGINVVGLKADVVDLIAILECRIAAHKDFNEGAIAEIEVKPDALFTTLEVKLGAYAKNVSIECLYGAQIPSKYAGMGDLFYEWLSQNCILRAVHPPQRSDMLVRSLRL